MQFIYRLIYAVVGTLVAFGLFVLFGILYATFMNLAYS